MTAYYNENDPKAAEWLRQLILEDCIAPGEVDERSISDVTPADLSGYDQHHFFAGIGGWSYALRLAGWPDDRPAWTGSCPCQPFSVAGNQQGVDDERHLWPIWRWLIDQRRPAIVFGEQVASKAGRHWLAGVRADLETLGYGVGCADLCAAGVGAPHIRQRLWWVADSKSVESRQGRVSRGKESPGEPSGARSGMGRTACRLGNTESDNERRAPNKTYRERLSLGRSGIPGRLGDAIKPGLEGHAGNEPDRHESGRVEADKNRPATTAGSYSWDGIYIPCSDGKARRIEPGIEPLVNGLSGRVGLLRGYGNAIVSHLAAAFVIAATGQTDQGPDT